MGKGNHAFHRLEIHRIAAHYVASGQWLNSPTVTMKLDDLGSMELLEEVEGSETLVLQVGILLLLRRALHPIDRRTHGGYGVRCNDGHMGVPALLWDGIGIDAVIRW